MKGEYDDRYKNYSELGHTAPGGSIDYKIRVSNGSDDKAVSTRRGRYPALAGDTLTDRTDTTVTNRATDLERRPALNSVTVLSSDGQPIDSAFVRIITAPMIPPPGPPKAGRSIRLRKSCP